METNLAILGAVIFVISIAFVVIYGTVDWGEGKI